MARSTADGRGGRGGRCLCCLERPPRHRVWARAGRLGGAARATAGRARDRGQRARAGGAGVDWRGAHARARTHRASDSVRRDRRRGRIRRSARRATFARRADSPACIYRPRRRRHRAHRPPRARRTPLPRHVLGPWGAFLGGVRRREPGECRWPCNRSDRESSRAQRTAYRAFRRSPRGWDQSQLDPADGLVRNRSPQRRSAGAPASR